MAVLSLSEAKDHLNIEGSQDDAEIMQTIDEAQAAVASKCGPLEAVSRTERVRGCSDALALNSTPAASLTSVTPVGGDPLDLDDLYLDTAAGVVTFDLGGSFTARAYDVVYQAGRTSCPDDLVRAVKELVKHMWQTQRGGTARPSRGGGESYSNTLPGAAYAFPFRVEQLMAPYVQAGFA